MVYRLEILDKDGVIDHLEMEVASLEEFCDKVRKYTKEAKSQNKGVRIRKIAD